MDPCQASSDGEMKKETFGDEGMIRDIFMSVHYSVYSLVSEAQFFFLGNMSNANCAPLFYLHNLHRPIIGGKQRGKRALGAFFLS